MSYMKTIVCLANSRKPPSGRGVAGREFDNGRFGAWIRPVSERQSAEISEEERRYQNGDDPKILDVMAIQMARAVPHIHQQENQLIDDSVYWEKKATVTWGQLQSAIENPGASLWLNGFSSSNGLNDQVPEASLKNFKRSLYLIRPENLVITVKPEGGDFSPARRRVRARFSLSGAYYKIGVTDPVVERQVLADKDGDTKMPDALMCISLSEDFKGNGYKLAAAIITKQRAEA